MNKLSSYCVILEKRKSGILHANSHLTKGTRREEFNLIWEIPLHPSVTYSHSSSIRHP